MSCRRINIRKQPLDYTLRRYYVDNFYLRHVAALPCGARVLDLGGKRLRKRGLFDITSFNLCVVYVNLDQDSGPDILADAANVPLSDESFDVVICAELLEHVQDPLSVLNESARLLVPGGKMLVTVPFLLRQHGDPEDYQRLTDTMLRRLFTQAGFVQVTIERQGYFWSVAADMYCAWVCYLELKGQIRPYPLAWLAERVAERFRNWALQRDARLSSEGGGEFYTSYTTGFGVLCVKDVSSR